MITEVITSFATGTYSVQRAAPPTLASGRTVAAVMVAWVGATAYVVGDRRTNAGKRYRCIVAGTSAAVGGPTTTAATIVDGTTTPVDTAVRWTYLGAGTADVDVFEIEASVQPVSDGRKLQVLREAFHASEIRLVLTSTAIETHTPAHQADVLTIAGETWTVIEHERWDAFGDSWTRAYAARTVLP